MSFTVFSYNATVLLIQPYPTQPNPSHVLENATQPNPTHGWTQPMSISGLNLRRGLSLGGKRILMMSKQRGFFRCDLNELKLHTRTHSCTGSRKQLAHCNLHHADEEPLLWLKREVVK